MRFLFAVLFTVVVISVIYTGEGRKHKEKKKWIKLYNKKRTTLQKIHHKRKESLEEANQQNNKNSGLSTAERKFDIHDKKRGKQNKPKHSGRKRNGEQSGKLEGNVRSFENKTDSKLFKHCNVSTDCGKNSCCVRKGPKRVCKEAPKEEGKRCSVSCPCAGGLFCNVKRRGRAMRGKCVAPENKPDDLKSALNKLEKIAKGLKRGRGKRKEKREKKRRGGNHRHNSYSNTTD